jgi:phosphatidylglycerophosphate synthase
MPVRPVLLVVRDKRRRRDLEACREQLAVLRARLFVPVELPVLPEFFESSSAPEPSPHRMADFEHPVDLAIVKRSMPAIVFMRETLGLTPNHVTALSIVASLVALVYLWRGQLVRFVLAAAVAYWFDDLDGAMARRYAMGTKLGEYLDHLSDLAFFVGIVVVLLTRYGAFGLQPVLVMVLLLSALLPATHNACGARACGKAEGAIGVVADVMCPTDRDESAKTSKRLRWLGGPSYQLIMYGMVCLLAVRCYRAGAFSWPLADSLLRRGCNQACQGR